MNILIPRGQRPDRLQRFGPPGLARVRPHPSSEPVVTLGGAVRRPQQLSVPALLTFGPRVRRRSDLHCVTTWSALGLDWSGVPYASVHDGLMRLLGPARSVGWVTFVGLDGYRACLRLDDAMADGVILADELDGAPLSLDHGAPLRLVAPAQYGYKSVKHVCAIEFRRRYDPGPAGWMSHPRGRVDREERSRYLPGPVWRVVWRTMLPRARRPYSAAGRQGDHDPA